jgi:hypothetical protein
METEILYSVYCLPLHTYLVTSVICVDDILVLGPITEIMLFH